MVKKVTTVATTVTTIITTEKDRARKKVMGLAAPYCLQLKVAVS